MKLKPCPFYGKINTLVVAGHHGRYSIICESCGSNGPISGGDREAKCLWDLRITDVDKEVL
jgi:hypothetical protein